jgi:hypothetical protein
MTSCYQPQSAPWIACVLLLLVLLLSGCAALNEQQPEPQISQKPVQGAEYEDALSARPNPSHVQPEGKPLDTISLPIPVAVTPAGKCHSTQECYHLQPTASHKKKKKGRRCEPQSLPFARCRSGISSCGLGWNNGPLTWFACEKQHNNTSLIPRDNSVLILGANKRNHMPTGHVAYVEKVIAEKAPHYRIIFSHTNYDRRCSLETNIEADYNSSAKTLDILTGAWKDWGKGLPVSGFILK